MGKIETIARQEKNCQSKNRETLEEGSLHEKSRESESNHQREDQFVGEGITRESEERNLSRIVIGSEPNRLREDRKKKIGGPNRKEG
jgi:hypothetical protein